LHLEKVTFGKASRYSTTTLRWWENY